MLNVVIVLEDESLFPTHWFDDRMEIYISLIIVKLMKNLAVSFYDLFNSSLKANANPKFYGKQRKSSPCLTITIKINIRLTSSCTCNCGSDYVGETATNLQERISEHEDTTRIS